MPDIRTQLEDELAAIGRGSNDAAASSPTAAAAAAPAPVATSYQLGPRVPVAQAAFQPGACPVGEQYLMQCNLVGRVVRKGFDEGCMVTVLFNNISKHRKKMAPIRSTREFQGAALSDTGAHKLFLQDVLCTAAAVL